MTTYRIVEAWEESAKAHRYWVFEVTKKGTRCLCSMGCRRTALYRVWRVVRDEDIVECITSTGLAREEFGVDYRSRLRRWFVDLEQVLPT